MSCCDSTQREFLKFQKRENFLSLCSLVFASLFFVLLVPMQTHAKVTAIANIPQSIPNITIDLDTGKILSGNQINMPWHPASLTKLMTLYVALDEIRKGQIAAGSPVIISSQANRMPASRMGYKIGVKLRLDTAMKILIVKSANDVSVALAQSVGGNVKNFVAMMNDAADNLGMKNTRFTNPNGLHDPQQVTSAGDMAILARALFLQFPQSKELFSLVAIKTKVKTHYSYNLLLERYKGANGMKTGFVCASGYNMVASATRGQTTLISVILGATSQTERAILAARALSAGFSNEKNQHPQLESVIAKSPDKPRNMRPILCTQQARKNRYEPGAGLAKINAPELSPRVRSNKIALVSTGNITDPPSDAYLSNSLKIRGEIPVPIRRPVFAAPEPLKPMDGMDRIGNAFRGTIPLPQMRPGT